MKIYGKRVGEDFAIYESDLSLESIQKFVGGYFEVIPLVVEGNTYLVVCDEEGKIKGKPVNCVINGEPIVGDIFICRRDRENMVGLSDKDMEILSNNFQ